MQRSLRGAAAGDGAVIDLDFPGEPVHRKLAPGKTILLFQPRFEVELLGVK